MFAIPSIKVLNDIYTKAKTIYTILQHVKANKHQCQRLCQRVELIVTISKKFSISDFDDNGMNQALEQLNDIIEQSLKLIKTFTNASLFGEYWDNTNYQKQFIRLNDQLLHSTITVNLAVNINFIFDHNQDSADQQADIIEISSKIDELALSLTKQNNKLKDEFNQRFDSLQNRFQQKSSNEQINNFLHISKEDLQIEELIGHGGFADVYRGIWISRDHRIAIKVFHLTNLTNKIKQNILNEISTMYQIRYDHLLGVLGACIESNYHAIIIEYMSLGSLFDILQNKEYNLSWSDRWSISLQMTKGINYLHMMSIIHRDIKALNILMEKTSYGYLVKISDFGLAKIQEEIQRENNQKEIIIAGTLRWKAPELFKLNPPSTASDVYSLGIVFWELATRYIPYDEWNDEDIIQNIMMGFREDIPLNVPKRFASIISNAWNQQPDKRPTCQQLIHEIKIASSLEMDRNKSTTCTSEPDETINERQNSTSSPVTNTESQLLSTVDEMSGVVNQLNDNSRFFTPPTILSDELKIEELIDQYELNANIQLCERQLTDQDMDVVVNLAIIKKQSRTLFLHSNRITWQGAMILGYALHGNTTLEELYIYSNHLSDMGVHCLAQPLEFSHSTLKRLHLANNEISNGGVEYLADMLRTNRTLTHLWLDNNDISSRGVQLLADVLINSNTSLSNLYLRENKLIDDLSVSSLIDMFEQNHSLKTLSISNCDLSETGKAILKEAISSKKEFNLDI